MRIQIGHIAMYLQSLLLAVAIGDAHSNLGDDSRQARALIGHVASDQADHWEQATRIFTLLPSESKWKPITTQAMALIEIRRGRYSEAWKLHASQSTKLGSASASMRLGHERLYMWLLLEAGLGKQAESQFKRLITIAINNELTDFERRELCDFLGSVIGMLQSPKGEKIISASILEKGRVALESLDSKTAVEQFKIGLQASEQWAADLQSRSEAFATAGSDKSLKQIDSLSRELEDAVVRKEESKNGLQQANNVKNECKDEERKVRVQLVSVTQELKKETPGKPRKPRDPSGSKPSRPRTKYRTDPVTKERVPDDQANATAERTYRLELADYERALEHYREESRTYDSRLEQWKQLDAARRAQLEGHKSNVMQTLAVKEAEVKTAQAAAMQQVELVKESTAAEKQLRRSLTIARIAHQHLTTADGASKSLIRPSNFQLINYSSEVTRLEKCLREATP
jgi:hypothetical protein